ncbi:hypothetical protein ACH5RR_024807 [Cinchona calisaya]|uniref:Uncharacterized protein n=1 Tax=Cinchona calisaya TaxID=153742 RepID=A0ABD2YXT4_9GENT
MVTGNDPIIKGFMNCVMLAWIVYMMLTQDGFDVKDTSSNHVQYVCSCTGVVFSNNVFQFGPDKILQTAAFQNDDEDMICMYDVYLHKIVSHPLVRDTAVAKHMVAVSTNLTVPGAWSINQHFYSAPFEKNIPVLAHLLIPWPFYLILEHWRNLHPTFNHHAAETPFALIVHRHASCFFLCSKYGLIQVSMKSNGKGISIDAVPLPYATGEFDFGEPGTNVGTTELQYIYLHERVLIVLPLKCQGCVIPCDFIGIVNCQQPVYLAGEVVSNHDELMSNFFAQPDALAYGKFKQFDSLSGFPLSFAIKFLNHKFFRIALGSLLYAIVYFVSWRTLRYLLLTLPDVTDFILFQLLAIYDTGLLKRALYGSNYNKRLTKGRAISTVESISRKRTLAGIAQTVAGYISPHFYNVLQRKTEEAAMATKRLKGLLECHTKFYMQGKEKSLQRWLEHELEVLVNVQELCEYEKQGQVRAALAEELAVLRQVDDFAFKGMNPPRAKNGFSSYKFLPFFAKAASMSPNAKMARIASLENMLIISSNSLVAVASQLSEAEERERAFTSQDQL